MADPTGSKPARLKIRTQDLRKALATILDRLEWNGEVVELDHDFYWNVSMNDRYAVETESRELTLGSLWHDLERIQEIADGREPVVYSLVWIAGLLRAIGEEGQKPDGSRLG